jgi:elongation factor 1-beta
MDTYEERLAKAQWLGGQAPSDEDAKVVEEMKKADAPNVMTHPHTFAWFSLASKFAPCITSTWKPAAAPKAQKGKKGKAAAPKVEKVEEKKVEAAEEEEIDMFGSDDEDDEASFDALCKAKQAAIDKANAKPKAIAKSIVMFEVKPLESETNLDDLFARILKEVQMEGCAWKQDCKKEPVAFGVFKLIVGAVIEDDKVSTDDIEEKIEAMDDMVQSVDIQSFNKL